jgi:hypothetical protein
MGHRIALTPGFSPAIVDQTIGTVSTVSSLGKTVGTEIPTSTFPTQPAN